MVDISGLDKAAVLAALYNASRPQGMGFMHYDPKPMTADEAREILAQVPSGYFDYLNGRVLKIELKGDSLEERLYDRDNGPGAAAKVIAALRTEGVANQTTEAIHRDGVREAAIIARSGMAKPALTPIPGGFEMGLSDVKEQLSPAVDKAVESLEQQRNT